MKLTYHISTRGRPDDLKQTLEHTLPNVKRDDTVVLVCCDSDDQVTLDRLHALPNDSRLHISIRPREDSRGEKTDRALTEAPADVYMMGHDCAPVLTPGFDQIVLDAASRYPDGIGCVYTPMVNMSFPAVQAITQKMAETIGYLYSHEYPYWFIDHELDDLARMIGRYQFVDVNVAVAERRPGRTIRLRDLKFWMAHFDLATFYRVDTAMKLIDRLSDEPWRKDMLRNAWQPIAMRSLMLHANLRLQAEQIEQSRGDQGPPDEGYLRLKAKAETLSAERRAQAEGFTWG